MDLLKVESYKDTFSKGKTQKAKPNMGVTNSLDDLAQLAEKQSSAYREKQATGIGADRQLKFDLDTGFQCANFYEGHDVEEVFLKGTSKRIWRELYSSRQIRFPPFSENGSGASCTRWWTAAT